MCRECRNENEITVFRLSAVGGRSEAVKLIERSNLRHLRQIENILTIIEIIRLISHLTDIIRWSCVITTLIKFQKVSYNAYNIFVKILHGISCI